MRHGWRGAAEIAQSLDNLYGFAALDRRGGSAQFDLMFDATLGDDLVRAFLVGANPSAARHMGRFSTTRRGAASGPHAAIRARAFWLRASRRRHERALRAVLRRPQRLVPRRAAPMETGDGLLARVRAQGGRLIARSGRRPGGGSEPCGNGAISLSARGNLHLRGLTDRSLPDLQARLADAGLIDADPEIERLRNIVASPLADLDPDAAFDLGPASRPSRRVSRRTSACARCRPSSALLLMRGRLPLGDVDADVRFEARLAERSPVFLAGDDVLAAQCAAGQTGEIAARLARAFLAFAGHARSAPRHARRCSSAPARAPSSAGRLRGEPALPSQRRTSLRDVLGRPRFGAATVVGTAAPFGELEAARFRRSSNARARCSATSLSLDALARFLLAGLDPRGADSRR